MIVEKDFLNKVREFGLNTYESKIWTALLSTGVSTAGELSDIADVPRSRSYDVLESLEKKGFIIMKLGKPIRYAAIKPEEVIERVKKKIREQTEKQLNSIERLSSDTLNKLASLHAQGMDSVNPAELTGAIKGRRNIYNHLATMIKNARKTIVIATSSQGIIRKKDILLRHLVKAKQRGVKIRIAAPVEVKSNELKELGKIAEIKDISLKARFCIIDKREILFMLKDDESVHPDYDLAIWSNTEFFSNFLEASFNIFLSRH